MLNFQHHGEHGMVPSILDHPTLDSVNYNAIQMDLYSQKQGQFHKHLYNQAMNSWKSGAIFYWALNSQHPAHSNNPLTEQINEWRCNEVKPVSLRPLLAVIILTTRWHTTMTSQLGWDGSGGRNWRMSRLMGWDKTSHPTSSVFQTDSSWPLWTLNLYVWKSLPG